MVFVGECRGRGVWEMEVPPAESEVGYEMWDEAEICENI